LHQSDCINVIFFPLFFFSIQIKAFLQHSHIVIPKPTPLLTPPQLLGLLTYLCIRLVGGGHVVQVPTSNVINSLIDPRGKILSQKKSKKKEKKDNPFEVKCE
jgi:hypothetical protein